MNKSNLTVTLRGLNIEFDGLYTIERVTWADPEEFWDWCHGGSLLPGIHQELQALLRAMWLLGCVPEEGKRVPWAIEEAVRETPWWRQLVVDLLVAAQTAVKETR